MSCRCGARLHAISNLSYRDVFHPYPSRVATRAVRRKSKSHSFVTQAHVELTVDRIVELGARQLRVLALAHFLICH